ncbi:MAG: replicative DNA helicase [Puniceicoccales bacterium]|nr:replicative DNA helicase [Puniceicoccales bacterium]
MRANDGALRSPPHSIELEQALLGCCIVDGGHDSVSLCIQKRVTAESFYYPANQVIFAEIYSIYQRGIPISEIVLRDSLVSGGKLVAGGGGAYLAQICSRVDICAHVNFFIERVRDYELLRRIIATAEGLVAGAYENQEDVAQFLSLAEEKIFAISGDVSQESAQHIDVPMKQAIQNFQSLLQRKDEFIGVASGFKDLDRLTGGFRPGEMTVVAARPSMGKTSFALNVAECAILPSPNGIAKAVPTLFFSLEMSADQLAMRLLCGRAGVNVQRLRDGYIPRGFQSDFLHVSQEFRSAPLWIDDASNLTILEMRARARRLHSKHRLGLVVIDYLQLISGTDSKVHREQQISEISRGVKGMAKELRLPVVVLSQLNRESEKEKRRPRLSDLRESGSIEQDADVVLIFARSQDGDEESELVDSSPEVIRELIVAKQRNGPVGTVRLLFDRSLTKFANYRDDGGTR